MYVRRFEYNEKQYHDELQKREELAAKLLTVEADLKKNCEIVYSALFECLMHVKMLRSHIECVLRWGVPPKYFLSIIKVYRNNSWIVAIRKRKESSTELDQNLYRLWYENVREIIA